MLCFSADPKTPARGYRTASKLKARLFHSYTGGKRVKKKSENVPPKWNIAVSGSVWVAAGER